MGRALLFVSRSRTRLARPTDKVPISRQTLLSGTGDECSRPGRALDRPGLSLPRTPQLRGGVGGVKSPKSGTIRVLLIVSVRCEAALPEGSGRGLGVGLRSSF